MNVEQRGSACECIVMNDDWSWKPAGDVHEGADVEGVR